MSRYTATQDWVRAQGDVMRSAESGFEAGYDAGFRAAQEAAQQAQPVMPTREQIERVLKRNLSTPPSGDIAGELLALFAKETTP